MSSTGVRYYNAADTARTAFEASIGDRCSMPSVRQTRTLTVFRILGVLAVLMGVDGLPRHRTGKSGAHHGKMQRGPETPFAAESVNLLLNMSTADASVQFSEVSNRSLSPWTYNTIHDESAYPPYMAEAKCLLTGCWSSAGREVMDLESTPIYHQVLVLRRVHGDREGYVYKLETKSIAVGCTCVRPNVIEHK